MVDLTGQTYWKKFIRTNNINHYKLIKQVGNIEIWQDKGGNGWVSRGVTKYYNPTMHIYYKISDTDYIYICEIEYSQETKKKLIDLFSNQEYTESLIEPYLKEGTYYTYNKYTEKIEVVKELYLDVRQDIDKIYFRTEEEIKEYNTKQIYETIGQNENYIQMYKNKIDELVQKNRELVSKL